MKPWVITLDFETRSRIDLKKAGAWAYARDRSTRALCLSWAIDDGPIRIWHAGDPPPTDLFRALQRCVVWEAHNSFFEWCIWNMRCVPDLKWPRLDAAKMRCSAALAATACLPRALDNACAALGLPGKDKIGSRAMLKLSKPRRPTKHDKREWFDDQELFEQLYYYNRQDVEIERALSDRLAPLSDFESRVFAADFNINHRGILVDRAFIIAALKMLKRIDASRNARLAKLTEGRVDSATKVAELVKELRASGLEIANLTAETVDDMLAHAPLTPLQKELLLIRQEGSRSSVKKYAAFLHVMDRHTDRVHGLYLYYGANATGRWAGRLVQPQNFPRGDAKGQKGESKNDIIEAMVAAIKAGDVSALKRWHESPVEVLSTALRGAFIATPGRVFAVGDYSAIEARVLFWLAEEQYGLEIYRKGGDIYRDMGSVIFNKPPEALNEEFERMLGKTTVLGCGYGMAGPKFIATCKRAYGIIIPTSLAFRSVAAYRKRYAMVPKLWYGVDDAAKRCIKTGASQRYRKLTFRMTAAGELRMRLPSGRDLIYRKARITRSGNREQIVFVNGKGFQETTYGGKLVENACQAYARDLLADAIVLAEFESNQELIPVMHSHDELVVEGKPGCSTKLKTLMETLPPHAAGLPMKVEVWEGTRYRK